MSDEKPDVPFKVGQRVYWIQEAPSWPESLFSYVYSGVVMSTGEAVTQVWNDQGNDPREHHALTFANDKVWVDRETPTEIIRNKLAKDRELRIEAQKIMDADDAKKAAETPAAAFKEGGAVVGPESSKRRRGWFR